MKTKPAQKFAVLLLLITAALWPPATSRAGGAALGGLAYIKGANMPWIDGAYYNDIAVNPHYPSWGSAYSSTDMNNDLADLHRMGVTVVRFWVNTDDQGCTLDANGAVTGVTALFWTNMDNIVSLAGSNGLSLYLTLNEGRADWLTNPAMANAYKTNCLIPLVQRYKGNSRVFGLDLMNEIDAWVADPHFGNPWISSGATWAQAQAYITNLAAAVHSADSTRLVSCSQVYHGWTNLPSWKGLGLDFYDFHYYADSIALPAVASLNVDKPVYVGECGQANADLAWSDALQSACELEALNSGYSGGYAGVSIWAYALPDWQTQDYIQYAMLNTNGSWRTVCYSMQNWSTSVVPTIASFAPVSGPVGMPVVIAGTDFTGASAVAFNGTAAAFTVNSATQITATVPAGASAGPITVTTANGPVTSTAVFTPVANLVIYDDNLGLENGFADWSWATVNDYSTSPVFSGSYSISVTGTNYTALWLENAGFSTSNYVSLSFWINGGAAGASGVQVLGVVGTASQGTTNLPTLAANAWQQFNLPLSALGVADIADCTGFWFEPNAGPTTTTFYVAAVQLIVPVPTRLSPVSAKPAAGKFVMQLAGQSGQTYRIETSTNLVNWTVVSTNSLTTTTTNITNSVISGSNRQFWRAD